MEYRVYRRRWLLLALVCCSGFTLRFFMWTFAAVNNVVAEYFNVDPYQVDILSIAPTISSIPIYLLVAFSGEHLGIRRQMLAVTLCMSVGSCLCACGLISRNLYGVVAAGRVLMGLPSAMIRVTRTILAANWFNKNETATAFSVVMVSFSLGGAFSTILTILLPHTQDSLNDTMTINNTQSSNYTNQHSEYERNVLLSGFGSMTLIMIVAFVLTFIYAEDHPPTPPSAAQENITNTKSQKLGFRNYLTHFLKNIRRIFKIKPFLLLTAAIFFRSSSILPTTLLSSLVLRTFPELTNMTPGIILLITLFAGACSGAASGRILDKTKAFKELTIIGNLGLILSGISLLLGHKFKNLPTLFVFYPAFFLIHELSYVSHVEFLLETTYPTDKTILISIFAIVYSVGKIVFTSLERMALQLGNEMYSVLVAVIPHIISLLLVTIVKKNYKRMEVGLQETEDAKGEIAKPQHSRKKLPTMETFG